MLQNDKLYCDWCKKEIEKSEIYITKPLPKRSGRSDNHIKHFHNRYGDEKTNPYLPNDCFDLHLLDVLHEFLYEPHHNSTLWLDSLAKFVFGRIGKNGGRNNNGNGNGSNGNNGKI